MESKPKPGLEEEEEMEARITSVQYGSNRRREHNIVDSLSDSIVRVAMAVGIGCVGIIFIGILIIGG